MSIKNIINNKKGLLLGFLLIIISSIYLINNLGHYSFVDYDEATYASVIRDTQASGDIVTLKRFDNNWFEKPPLYFWASILSTSIFGINEFAMRLPSAIFAVLIVYGVFLIVKELTNRDDLAFYSSLTLLFISPFYYYSRELRLDSGVLMSVVLAFYFLLISMRKKYFGILIAPMLAIGFMIKSVIVGLFLPIVLIYSFVYKQWRWFLNKYVYLGIPIALLIVLPWHIVENLRHGQKFWQSYLGYHVIVRAINGIGIGFERSSGTSFDYFLYLWMYVKPFTVVMLSLLLVFLFGLFKKNVNKILTFSLLSIVFILIIFTIAKTHIGSYLLPMFPFAAIFVTNTIFNSNYKIKYFVSVIILFLVIIFMGVFNKYDKNTILPYQTEEKAASIIYREISKGEPLFILHWPTHESIRYYSDTNPEFINFSLNKDSIIKGPAFIILNKAYLDYFRDKNGKTLPEYKDLDLYFNGDYLMLIRSNKDIVIHKGFADENQYYSAVK